MFSSLSWKKETSAATIQASKPHHTFIPEPLGLKNFDDACRDNLHCINRRICLSLTATSVHKMERRCNFDLERASVGSYGKKQPVVLFPPPLPMLARTQDRKSYMPWNYRRRYYKDGHMVIKEFEFDHHDYFLVIRENKQLSLQKVYIDKESLVNQENELPTDKQSLVQQKMDKEEMTVVVHIETMLEESPSPPTQSSDSGSSSSSSASDSTSLPSDIEDEESCSNEEVKCMDSGKVLLELPQPFRREMVEDETSTLVVTLLTSSPPSPEPAFPELCEEAYAIENSILFRGQLLT